MSRLAVAAALVVLLFSSIAAAPPRRPKCCHGCNMYSCSTEQCGKTCKLGPKCAHCWKKDCDGNH